jgi:hypothetical protein
MSMMNEDVIVRGYKSSVKLPCLPIWNRPPLAAPAQKPSAETVSAVPAMSR